MSAPLRRSPVSRIHAALGAVVDVESGWELVSSYGDEETERARLRASVAIIDITARGKVDVRGAIEGPLGAAGDVLTARVAKDWALVLLEPGGEDVVLPKLAAAAGPGAMVTDATHLFAGFAIAGPELPGALARLTSWDPGTLAPGSATGAPIGEVRAVVVRRDFEISVLEFYVTTEFARFAWETMLDAVVRTGGAPAGWSPLRAEGWS